MHTGRAKLAYSPQPSGYLEDVGHGAMDRPSGLLHLGPAAGPLQTTFPQSKPSPRELCAQAPPPSPATGWLRKRPRPESRALRGARNCLLLFCYYLAFKKKKKKKPL